MKWAHDTVPFRRQAFDDERSAPRIPRTQEPPPLYDDRPPDRLFVVPITQSILPHLLTLHCALKPVGADWHVVPHSRKDQEAILSFLKVKRIHGVMRSLPAGSLFLLAKTREHNLPPTTQKPFSRKRSW